MIPLNEPHLSDKRLAYITEHLHTGCISSEERFIEAFERSGADYCCMLPAVAESVT
jgi:dTDP-4-amino-4,6-dideoxygalactose transaminase